MKTKVIGVDVSKQFFDIYLNGQVIRYDNTAKGIKLFKKKLKGQCRIAMESTGNYCYLLAHDLIQSGHKVYIINPLQIKHFARMGLSKAKTDAIDAKKITLYAELFIKDLKEYSFASNQVEESKQIFTSISLLKKEKTALSNELEALTKHPYKSIEVLRSIKKMIKYLKKEIDYLCQKAISLIKEVFGKMFDNIESISGIGPYTAAFLISKTNGFVNFENAKQLSSYFGCCPRIIESGTSIKARGAISKIGHSDVRTTLYMCSLSASKHNNSCKELYHRLLQKGKVNKVALMAVSNKLLRQIFAIAKSGEKFDNMYYRVSA